MAARTAADMFTRGMDSGVCADTYCDWYVVSE